MTKDRKNTMIELRADVKKLVGMLISNTGQPASYSDYIYAKQKISYLCGFDAFHSNKFDQQQYDAALKYYCDKVGL